MEIQPKWLSHLLSFYLSIVLRFIPDINIFRTSLVVSLMDVIVNLYYRFCGLSPFSVSIDDQTSMNFWAPIHPKSNKPNLIIIHGYGSESKWQMLFQVGPLSKLFNLYSPDLLFFGTSYTSQPDRSEVFQAKCVLEGMKKLGLTRYSVFGISYGGFVTYRMADMQPEVMEKIVIASSGIGCTEAQKAEHLGKLGRSVPDLLLPQNPGDLRLLISMAFSKSNPLKWVPDFVLQQFINVLGGSNRKEKRELVEHLLDTGGPQISSNINVDTLLLWGDKDNIFPLTLAYQLQRQLGPKAKLEILKDTGHASNLESATQVNETIIHFALSDYACNGKHM